MTAEILQFRGVNGAEASGRTMQASSIDELRAKAWSSFYSQERLSGASPNLAHARADYFITKRFDGLIDDIREIMGADRG
jgi:hypothetical protein